MKDDDDFVNELKLHVVSTLIRVFRVTLEKHTNRKALRGGDTNRSLR